jgi:diguanylate cyclase (GGDEF)-like protein/PAS domain S-box-containing protein
MTGAFTHRLAALRQRAQDLLQHHPHPDAIQVPDDIARLSEDLRIYATELELQTDELQAAQQRAELISSRYQQLFDHMPLAALVVDHYGLVREGNQQAQTWLGPAHVSSGGDRRLLRQLASDSMRQLLAQLQRPTESAPATLVLRLELGMAEASPKRVDAHLLPLPLTYHADGLFLLLLHDRSAEAGLQDHRLLLQTLIDSSSDRICATDLQGRVILCNEAALLQLQRQRHEVLGLRRESLMPLSDAVRHKQADRQVLDTGAPVSLIEEIDSPGALGQPRVYLTNKFPLRGADGQWLGVGCMARDISAEREAQRQQRLSETVFMSATEAIIVTDPDTRIVRVNPAFERLSGFSAATVVGQKANLLRSGRQSMGFYQSMWAAIHTTGHWEGELTNRSANGGYHTVWSTMTALKGPNGQITGYMAVQTDLTALRLAESEVARLSSYDSLTGLPNRALLLDRLERLQAYAHRHGDAFSLLFADLDYFKEVNDTLGHQTGDLLLQTVAQRLRDAVRLQDTVARIGGDEFVVLLPCTGREAALGLAQKLQKVLRQPLDLDGLNDYRPQISVGVAEYPSDGDSAQLLLRNADTAMYAAKLGGRNRAEPYTPAMSEASVRLFALQSDLSKAVERGELRMVLQPKFRLSDQHIIGAEALVRWERPGHGLTSPAEFIPVAEKAGLVGLIDTWMLEQVVQHLHHWTQAGQWPHDWSLALNQTASDLRSHSWLLHLRELLQAYPIAFGSLHIELTESDLLQPTPDMIGQLHALRELGVCLAIDDFGTGYSSLAYLKSLPVSVIKIDQGFVRDMTTDANARILVEAMVDLAHKLGHSLVAEGVETQAQCAALHAMGCEAGQGYLVSPPLNVADFSTLCIDPPAAR